MKRIDLLKKRQTRLKEEIVANLDLLMGTIGKSPSMAGHNLTIPRLKGKPFLYMSEKRSSERQKK